MARGGSCRPRGRPPRNPPPPQSTNNRSRRGKKRSPSNGSSAESTFRSSSQESSRSSKHIEDVEGHEEGGDFRPKLYDSDEKIYNPYREETPPSSEDDFHYYISGVDVEKPMKLTYYDEFGVEDEIRETKDPNFHKERYKVVRAEHVKQKPKTKNVDICVVCEETCEDLVKCVRCPAAFHKACIEGTMSLVKPKYEQWTCKRCRYEQHVLKRPRRVAKTLPFDEEERLVSSIDSRIQLLKEDSEKVNHNTFFNLVAGLANPKSFTLRKGLADKLEDVPYMEHVPRKEEAPVETPCFYCHFETSSDKPGILCDYCPAVFHIHCLDPPMTTVLNEFWMCPLHPEYAIDTYAVNSVSISKRMKLWKEYQKETNENKEFAKTVIKMQAEAKLEKRSSRPRKLADVPGFVEFSYGCEPDDPILLDAPARESDDDFDITEEEFFKTLPVDREPLYDATEQDIVQMKHAFCAYMKNKKLTDSKGTNDVQLFSFQNNLRSQKDAEFTTVDQCYYPETPYRQNQEIYALFEHVCSEIRTKFSYLLEKPKVRPFNIQRIPTAAKSYTPKGSHKPALDKNVRDLVAMPPPPLPYATRFKKPEFLQLMSTHDLFDGQFCFPLLTLDDDMIYFPRYYSDGQNIILRIERLPDNMMDSSFKHKKRTEEALKQFPEAFVVSMPLIEQKYVESMKKRRKRKVRMPKLEYFIAKQKKLNSQLRKIKEWEAAKTVRAGEIQAWEVKKAEFIASFMPTRNLYEKALATEASNILEKTSKGFCESPDIRRRFRKNTMELNRVKKQVEEFDRVMNEYETTKPEDIPDIGITPKKQAKWRKRIKLGYKPYFLTDAIEKTRFNQIPIPTEINKATLKKYFKQKKVLMNYRRLALKKFIGWLKCKRYNMKKELRHLKSDFKSKKHPLITLLEKRNKDVHSHFGQCLVLNNVNFKKLVPIECRKMGNNLYLTMLEMDGDTWQVLRRLNYNDTVMAFSQTMDVRRKLVIGEGDCHVAGEFRLTDYSALRVAAILFEKREKLRTSKYCINAGLFNQWSKELRWTSPGQPILDSRYMHLKYPIIGSLTIEKPYHSYANIPLYYPLCLFGTSPEAHIDLMLLAPRCQYIRSIHFKVTYSRIDMLAKVVPMNGYVVYDGVLYGEDLDVSKFVVDCPCVRRLAAAKRFPDTLDGFLVDTNSRFMIGCLEFSVFLMEPEYLWNQIPELTPGVFTLPESLEVEPSIDDCLVPFEGEFNYDRYLTPNDFKKMAPDDVMLKSNDFVRRKRYPRKQKNIAVKRIPIELTDMQLPPSETVKTNVTATEPVVKPCTKPVKKTRQQKIAACLKYLKLQNRKERRNRIQRRWRTVFAKVNLQKSVTNTNLDIADKTLKEVQAEIKKKIEKENEESSQKWREKRKKGRGRGKKAAAPLDLANPPPPPKPRAPRTPRVPKPVVPFVQTSGPVTRASRKRGYFGDVESEVFLALPLNPPPRKRKPKEPPPLVPLEVTKAPQEPETLNAGPMEQIDPLPNEPVEVMVLDEQEATNVVAEPDMSAQCELQKNDEVEIINSDIVESTEKVPDETLDIPVVEPFTQKNTEVSTTLSVNTLEPVESTAAMALETFVSSTAENQSNLLNQTTDKKKASKVRSHKRYLKRLAKHNAKRIQMGLKPLPPHKSQLRHTTSNLKVEAKKKPRPKKNQPQKHPKSNQQSDIFVWVPPENGNQLRFKLRRQRVTDQPTMFEEQPKLKKGQKSKRSLSKLASGHLSDSEKQPKVTRQLRSQTRSNLQTPTSCLERSVSPSTRQLRSQTRLMVTAGQESELVKLVVPDVNIVKRQTYCRRSKTNARKRWLYPDTFLEPTYEADFDLLEPPLNQKRSTSKKRNYIRKLLRARKQSKETQKSTPKDSVNSKPSTSLKQPQSEKLLNVKPRCMHERASKTAANALLKQLIHQQPSSIDVQQSTTRLSSQRYLEMNNVLPIENQTKKKLPLTKPATRQKLFKKEEPPELSQREPYTRNSKTKATVLLKKSISENQLKSKKQSNFEDLFKFTQTQESQHLPTTKRPPQQHIPLTGEASVLQMRCKLQRKSKIKAYERIQQAIPVNSQKFEIPNPRKRQISRRNSGKERAFKKQRLSFDRFKFGELDQSTDAMNSDVSKKDKFSKSKSKDRSKQVECTLYRQQVAAKQAELILLLAEEANLSDDDVNFMLAAVPNIKSVLKKPKALPDLEAEQFPVGVTEVPNKGSLKKQKTTKPKPKKVKKKPPHATGVVEQSTSSVKPSVSTEKYSKQSYETYAKSDIPYNEPSTSHEAYDEPTTSYEVYFQPPATYEAYSQPSTSQEAYADVVSYTQPAAYEYDYQLESEPVATTSLESGHVMEFSGGEPNFAYWYGQQEQYEQPAEECVQMEVDAQYLSEYEVHYVEQYPEHYHEEYEQPLPTDRDNNSDNEEIDVVN